MEFFKRPVLGVDLGSRTIKGVRLKKRKGRVVLDNYFFHDLGQTAENYPSEPNLEETLGAGVELRKLQRARFAATVSDREVIHLNLRLPAMKAEELRTAVRHELAEQTGIPAEELAFDFVVRDEKPARGRVASEAEVSVDAYGTRRQIVDELVSTLSRARLRPAAIESDVLAIAAMLEFNRYLEPAKAYAVFDLGERHQTAFLMVGGQVVLSRTADTGWSAINQALGAELGLSYLQAEHQKCRYDFNSSDAGEKRAEEAIDGAYAAIFSEVRRSLDFFREHANGQAVIDQAILVGGGSQSQNIERVFEMFFKVPTVVANPFRDIEIYASGSRGQSASEIGNLAPYMAVAVGAALGGVVTGGKRQ